MKSKSMVFFDFDNMVFYPEFVYMLGYLWADGSIDTHGYHRKVSLEIISSDAEAIEPILNRCGLWTKYSRIRQNQKIANRCINNSQTTRFRVSHKKFVDFLVNHDYRDKNNNYNKILSAIPKQLHQHWFRGLFDGDGNFLLKNRSNGSHYNCSRCTLAGPYDQDWTSIKEYLYTNGITDGFHIMRNKSDIYTGGSSFVLHKKSTVFKFLNLIYNTRDGIWLQRKYEAAVAILDQLENNHENNIGIPLEIDGKYFPSISSAARFLNITDAGLHYRLHIRPDKFNYKIL